VRSFRCSVLVKVGAAAAAAVLASAGSAVSAFAASPTGPVGSVPASDVPHLLNTTTTSAPVSQVRQLVQCGSTMYAVGTFSQIKRDSTTYTRNGAFSFSATAPYKVTSWDPEVNGTVNTIAFNGTDCTNAFLGGKFTTVGATAAKNIAEVSTSTGAVVPTFKANANAQVETIVSSNGHLLTGGYFTAINGSPADPYFTSLNPATGLNDGYLALGISGFYSFTDDGGHTASSNPTRVYNQQISPDGTKDLIEGDFTSVGGQPRQQIAMLDLGVTSVTTDAWYATEFNQACFVGEPFYAQAAAWSPDGQTIYVASTGYKPSNGQGYSTSDPRAGLCDTAAAFPATSAPVTHLWINYTGCDSMFATAADASTAYFAGHERWADNPNGCDSPGPGALAAPGMVGLSPTAGSVTFNPTLSRGLGADDMLITPAGLWIASDNYDGSQSCGGVAGHAGICFLPYPA
jgi:hypothetical protein